MKKYYSAPKLFIAPSVKFDIVTASLTEGDTSGGTEIPKEAQAPERNNPIWE